MASKKRATRSELPEASYPKTMAKVKRKVPETSANATTSSAGGTSGHTCSVCEDIIREAKGRGKGQDAVFCDGSCRAWLHRHCAGLSRARFEAVANSEEEFLCSTCQREGQEETIALLKDEVAALRAEFLQLKDSVVALKASTVQNTGRRPSKEARPSWNVVVDRGSKRHPNKRREQGRGTAERKDTNEPPETQPKQPSSRKRVVISGARRIWGTMRTTTPTAVTNALNQLTTVDVTQLTVKRKFKTAANNPTRIQKWWFVVRGEEDMLQQVEGAWNSVAMQTAWKLEPAYRYEDDTDQSDQNEQGAVPAHAQQSANVLNVAETAADNVSSVSHNAPLSSSFVLNVAETVADNVSSVSHNAPLSLSFLDKQ